MKDKHCDWCGEEFPVSDVFFCEMPNGKHICENCIPEEFEQLIKYIKSLEQQIK